MFLSLDEDNNGTLTVEEMRHGMLKAGLEQIPEDLLQIMKDVRAAGARLMALARKLLYTQ